MREERYNRWSRENCQPSDKEALRPAKSLGSPQECSKLPKFRCNPIDRLAYGVKLKTCIISEFLFLLHQLPQFQDFPDKT